MGRWLVYQKDNQFGVNGMDDLIALAEKNELVAGDLIQPPEAEDWVYAVEIEELQEFLPADVDDDEILKKSLFSGPVAAIIALFFLAITGVGASLSYSFYNQMPSDDDMLFGKNGLKYTQMIITESTSLRASEEAKAATGLSLPKDTVVELLSKRGDQYKIRTNDGSEGWINLRMALPMYRIAGGEIQEAMDPLYNPDHYLVVSNASWLQVDKKNEKLTVFQFSLNNNSDYAMTDLILQATIKDSKGAETERVEFAIEGLLPPRKTTMVGTLAPAKGDGKPRLITDTTFAELLLTNPDLQLRHTDGVEVEMQTADFAGTRIDVLEVRAIPNEK